MVLSLWLRRYHHRRHHDGKFEIKVCDDGDFVFERSDGTPIVPVEPAVASTWFYVPDAITAETPWALSRGERCNFAHTVSVLAETVAGHGP